MVINWRKRCFATAIQIFIWPAVIGKIEQILRDDQQDIPHQRFILKLPGTRQTILVVHNLDHGERLGLKQDDVLLVAGEYVWYQFGGLIHLTHFDPNGIFIPGTAKVIKKVSYQSASA